MPGVAFVSPMEQPKTDGIDPRAREIAKLVAMADQLDVREQEQIDKLKREFAMERVRITTRLGLLMGATAVLEVAVRKGKPKRAWKKVAQAIADNPDFGYHDLGPILYEDFDESKLQNLRSLLYHMRKAKVIEGEPGSWKLLKTPEEIEWTKAEEDAE